MNKLMKSLRRIAFRRLSIKSDSFFDLDFDDTDITTTRKDSSFRSNFDSVNASMKDVFTSNLSNQQSELTRHHGLRLSEVECSHGYHR